MSEKLTIYNDAHYMNIALQEAQKAGEAGEVPVGCIIVSNDKIIARTHNLTETLNDVTAHAEMQAITSAENYLGGKYLNDCIMYVTLEPCVMCAGALYWAQLGRLVFGANDGKKGFTITGKHILHKNTSVVSGILEKECSQILSEFFRKLR